MTDVWKDGRYVAVCEHCLQVIRSDTGRAGHWVHAAGEHRGKMRCDPMDTKQPYGLEAEVVGIISDSTLLKKDILDALNQTD